MPRYSLAVPVKITRYYVLEAKDADKAMKLMGKHLEDVDDDAYLDSLYDKHALEILNDIDGYELIDREWESCTLESENLGLQSARERNRRYW